MNISYKNLDEFPKRLKHVRESRHMSQGQLSDYINYSRNYINRLENGAGLPSLYALLEIARAMDISTDYLLTGSESKRNDSLDKEIAFLSQKQRDAIANAIKELNKPIKDK